MKRKTVLLGWVLAGAWTAGLGQGAGGTFAPPPSQIVQQGNGYAVTGRVICGDTQRPARFAQVMLLPATEGDGGNFDGRSRPSSARTDLDGNFTIPNVSPGDYFVTGSLSGYINQTTEVRAVLEAGTEVTSLSGVPEVRVGAGGATTALTLQRGAVIAGTVVWDDGSPAGGVQVMAALAPPTGVPSTSAAQVQTAPANRPGGSGGGFSGTQTDDRGHFRLTGLASGTYLVRAAVQAPSPVRGDDRGFNRTLSLFVYAPDKMRRTDAAAITLGAGEERDDVTVTMGLAALHSVSGSLSSPGTAVRSGTVSLTDQTDATLSRTGTISPDGSFAIPYVPPGNYTLNVNASAQAASTGGRGGYAPASTAGGSNTRFQPLQESITVTDSDVTGLSLNMSPAAGTP